MQLRIQIIQTSEGSNSLEKRGQTGFQNSRPKTVQRSGSRVSSSRLKIRINPAKLKIEVSCSKEEDNDDEETSIQGRTQFIGTSTQSHQINSGSWNLRGNDEVEEESENLSQRGAERSSVENENGWRQFESHSWPGSRLNYPGKSIPAEKEPDATEGLNHLTILNQTHGITSSESTLKSELPAANVNNLFIVVGGDGFSRERRPYGFAHYQQYSVGALGSTHSSNAVANFDTLRGLPASNTEEQDKLMRESNQVTLSGHGLSATRGLQSSGQERSLGIAQQVGVGFVDSASGLETGLSGRGYADRATSRTGNFGGLQATSNQQSGQQSQQQFSNTEQSGLRNTVGSTSGSVHYTNNGGAAAGLGSSDTGGGGYSSRRSDQSNLNQGQAFNEEVSSGLGSGATGKGYSDRVGSQYYQNQGQALSEGETSGMGLRDTGEGGYFDERSGLYKQNQGQAFNQASSEGETSRMGLRGSGDGRYSDGGSGLYSQNQGQAIRVSGSSGLGSRGIGGGEGNSDRVSGQNNQIHGTAFSRGAKSGLGSSGTGGGGYSDSLDGQYNQNQAQSFSQSGPSRLGSRVPEEGGYSNRQQAFNKGATSGLGSSGTGRVGFSDTEDGQYSQNQGHASNEGAILGLDSRGNERTGSSDRASGLNNQNQGHSLSQRRTSGLGSVGTEGAGYTDREDSLDNQNQGRGGRLGLGSRGARRGGFSDSLNGQSNQNQGQTFNEVAPNKPNQSRRRTNSERSLTGQRKVPYDSLEDLDLNNDYSNQIDDSNRREQSSSGPLGSRVNNGVSKGRGRDNIVEDRNISKGKDQRIGATALTQSSGNDRDSRRKSQGRNSVPRRSSTSGEADSNIDVDYEDLLDVKPRPRQSKPRKTSSSKKFQEKDNVDFELKPDEKPAVPRKASGSGRAFEPESSESTRRRRPANSNSSRQPTGSRIIRFGSKSDDNTDDEAYLAKRERGKKASFTCNLKSKATFCHFNTKG